MKYVRFKDNIKEIIGEINSHYIVGRRKGRYKDLVQVNKKRIGIRLSDSIEELCDALVVVAEDGGKEFHRYCPTASDSFDDLKKRYYEKYGWAIYGAIWTDDGLKYVAKMNKSKGELELL